MKAITLVLLCALAGFGLALAQHDGPQQAQPPDESNYPDSEKQIPQGHYCKAPDVTIGPKETRAHHCDCQYSCTVDKDGNITEHEAPGCKAFCHLNGRRCTCHTEESCALIGQVGNALMDMDGNIVAMMKDQR